jgi:CRP/FNR family cyclic AMP-dependent transcriptional regulator
LHLLSGSGGERKIEKYQKHQVIFQQGDPADAVYYIKMGKIQISLVSKQGKARIIAELDQNAFFGESCLSGQTVHLGTATTTTTAIVIKITKGDMIRLLRDDPQFSELFMSFLLARNVQIEADLIDHLFNSSEKRLARILLMLSNIGEVGSLRTIPKVSQEVLAARVGTTRSRINSFMNKFRKLGFIEYNGVLKINQSLMNVIVHG